MTARPTLCTDLDAEAGPVTCCRCWRRTDLDRAGARRAGWDPARSRSQRDLDAGPLVCPECLAAAIDHALAAALTIGHRP